MNHFVFIVMDSARYDSVMAARTPNLARLGTVEKRYSYASWTAPSHYAFLMGLMPHRNPRGVFASDVYKDEFLRWRIRLGVEALEFKTFVPRLNLPSVLHRLGYRCTGYVSLPVLNPTTLIATGFDRYELWPTHNDFAGMLDAIEFPADGAPQFYFLNLGETHYPYMIANADLPRIHGVHGVFKHLDDLVASPPPDTSASAEYHMAPAEWFAPETLERFRRHQIACVEHLDGLFGRLFAMCPENTWIVITADHGELFGEDGFFGHGPIVHEKVFEVPFVEGLVPR